MMQYKRYVLFTIFVFDCLSARMNYSDTSFLKTPGVRKSLMAEGFREIYFRTPDGLRLNGLLLLRDNARYNMIVCAGWLPGKMEQMATFFDILPPDCNILFFDARGHGKSEGPLFREVWRYGVNEYKDIIGGIVLLHHLTKLPTIVSGICSGAFNAAHAFIALEKKHLLARYGVKGLVFDSGWGSVTTISSSIVVSGFERRFLRTLKWLYGTKDQTALKQKILYTCGMAGISVLYGLFYNCIVKPLVVQYEHKTNLFDKMSLISVPVYFIHANDDSYANACDVTTLASCTQHNNVLILEQSYHAKNHLRQQETYKNKLIAFVESAIATS